MGFHLPALRRRSAAARATGLDISPMKRKHLKSVVAIEQQVFPSPWSLSLYLNELSQPATRAYFVAVSDEHVIGYAGLMIVVGEGHVTTIGVDPSWQRRGIGRKLLLTLALAAKERGAEDLTLEVRMSNAGAQALYHEFGFVPAGIRKNYYAEVHEDAIVMWAHDLQGESMAARLAGIAERAAAPPQQ